MPRSLVSSMFMTLDGVVESPENWSMAFWNDEIQNAMSGGMFEAAALVLGRVTYESFAASWGSRPEDEPGVAHMNSVRKYVASRTLDTVDWNNSELLGEDPAAAIRDLKAEDGKDLAVSGSPTLVRWLIDEGLLDELDLLVYPVILGTGAQLFTGLESKHTFTLTGSETFSNGVLHLTYRTSPTA